MTNENAKKLRFVQRSYFIKVMKTVQFLGRQGIAFQGESENDNFTQALLFRGKDDTNISQRLNAPTTRQLKKICSSRLPKQTARNYEQTCFVYKTFANPIQSVFCANS